MKSFTGGQARQLNDGSPNFPGRDFFSRGNSAGIWDENFEHDPTYFTRAHTLLSCRPVSFFVPLLAARSAIVIVAFGAISGEGEARGEREREKEFRSRLGWQLHAFNACGLRLCRNYVEQRYGITKMSKRKIMVRKEGEGENWQKGWLVGLTSIVEINGPWSKKKKNIVGKDSGHVAIAKITLGVFVTFYILLQKHFLI